MCTDTSHKWKNQKRWNIRINCFKVVLHIFIHAWEEHIASKLKICENTWWTLSPPLFKSFPKTVLRLAYKMLKSISQIRCWFSCVFCQKLLFHFTFGAIFLFDRHLVSEVLDNKALQQCKDTCVGMHDKPLMLEITFTHY